MTDPTIHESATRLVIERLAFSEAELIERIVDLASDLRALRETLKVSVDLLYSTNLKLDRSTATVAQLHQALRDAHGEIAMLREQAA
jgi:uncharacterized coiled-coil DUF342 family protein